MRTIKRQLRQFYADLGIGVRRAEKLIKSDLNAVRRYTNPRVGVHPEHQLIQAMLWCHTLQGWRYWAARHYGLKESPSILDIPSPLHA